MSTDLKQTVFLPYTPFPMRGNLPEKELEILSFWTSLGLEKKQRDVRHGQPLFVLHDGPPYANGHIHIGHAVNKIFKDVVNRVHFMANRDVNFIPGWDCHGLPIEAKVEENYKAQGLSKKEVDTLSFRSACRAFAETWIGVQKEEFLRMGLMGDWAHPYTTMSPQEEAGIVEAFLKIFMAGDVYRGVKPVLWSVVEETALAEAEVEYHEVQSPAIDVRFSIVESPLAVLKGASSVIWTTTPWTLPANRAIAYGPEMTYVALRVEQVGDGALARVGGSLLVAHDLVDAFVKRSGIERHTVLETFLGKDLKGTVAAHPFRGQGYDFAVPLLPGVHVTADAGTGLVHTAPSHGVEDFAVGREFGLEVPELVGSAGLFKEDVPLFAGAHVYKVNPQIIATLKEAGALLSHEKLTHTYPHSWRSKTPLIYRATPQWFLAMDGEQKLRARALAAIDEVQWIPPAGRTRLHNMVATRPDWCLSRQRVWGVPIPLFLHKETGEPIKDARVNDRILEIMGKEGTDAWWTRDVAAFLEPFYPADQFEKATDILDVWFDSGVTHEFVLKKRGIPCPADLYFEGSDQHRGWFQSSLLTACMLDGKAPYKSVFTHGFVMDGAGRKMSKSQGNVVSPQEMIAAKGADILRLWGLSSDFEKDIRVGPELLKHVEDLYRRIRNTFRYLLGALSDFSVGARVPREKMPPLERWVYQRLASLQRKIHEASQTYRFQAVFQEIHYFCANDLSAFYFDVRKDALYCDKRDGVERRAAQTLMQDILSTLVLELAPFLVFTCEEVWQTMVKNLKEVFPKLGPSVHLAQFLALPLEEDTALEQDFDILRRVRDVVTGALEKARADKTIGSSLGACPVVYVPAAWRAHVTAPALEAICLTSGLSLRFETPPAGLFMRDDIPDVAVAVELATGVKCERCWKILAEVEPPQNLCLRCVEVVAS